MHAIAEEKAHAARLVHFNREVVRRSGGRGWHIWSISGDFTPMSTYGSYLASCSHLLLVASHWNARVKGSVYTGVNKAPDNAAER
jgi:hypothetical protein